MHRLFLLLLLSSTAAAMEPPRSQDPGWQLELIASEPDLVTPTGCCFDNQGRLLVIECHTHFPPDDYPGPKTDRIYRFDDSDGDGTLDRKQLFYEGGTASMNIVNLRDGSFAVATRSEIVRLRDTNEDGLADERSVLLTHLTAAEYPHNGLGGLTLGNDGLLYVGQGENFGETYSLVGSDGTRQVGGGEGGNVFRCRSDGGHVERIATGFWNPFGLCFDSSDRLWSVGNDPDSMPPNRLMHVVPGGDYGFQFRFGRAGIHPLQAWDGELPGTLPMVAGTGEAACAVVPYHGHLLVTSWGDNRIELHTPVARGASWGSTVEVLVQGDSLFRPVGLAIAPDDSIYVTDWVDRSYPVHLKGRLWRLSRKPTAVPVQSELPILSADESLAAALRSDLNMAVQDRLNALNSSDKFIAQAASYGLVQTQQLGSLDRTSIATAQQRAGVISAWRWTELTDPQALTTEARKSWIDWGMQQTSEDVVLTALRWATERRCVDQLPTIQTRLSHTDISPRLFAALIASIAYLESGSASGRSRDPVIEKRLIDFASNTDHSASLRGMAIRRIPAASDAPTDQELGGWAVQQPDRDLTREVVRLLAERNRPSALEQLAVIAENESLDLQSRADAIAGLAKNADLHAALINKLALPRQADVLKVEAKRIQNRSWQADQTRPDKEDLDAWTTLIGDGGDGDAGRRVFFRTTCVNCHMHSGRGSRTGPDLTTLAGNMTRRRVLESILHPSKEIGPLYVPWKILTEDGNVLTGLKLDAAGIGNTRRFQGADGNIFEVDLLEIQQQEPVTQSIMPTGLEGTISIDEMRDLIAFLTTE